MIRVGVLSPHAAEGAEWELPLLAPGLVSTTVSRIRAGGLGEAAGLRDMAGDDVVDEAVSAFPPGSADVLAYASTSTAYVLGHDAETRLVDRISRQWTVPACSASMSAVEALRSLDVARVALVHPPWFGAELGDLGVAYFRGQGLTVVGSFVADVPDDPALVTPRTVVDGIPRHVGADADAVFIGGNGFRAALAIDDLEDKLGCPVLTSNQVLLRSILALAGMSPDS
jgi:maleate isomerase